MPSEEGCDNLKVKKNRKSENRLIIQATKQRLMPENKIKLEGDLSEISVPQIFHALSVSNATGLFHWTHFSREKKVYLFKGKIVFASSNRKQERLGEVLLRQGRVRVKDYVEASRRIRESKRLGQILIEMGVLNKEEIKAGVIEQVRDIVYGLFNETDGTYSFHEEKDLLKEVITLNINTPELIMGGVQQITDWNRILQTLSGIETIFEPSARTEKKRLEVQLSDEENRIFQLVDGKRSVADICARIAGNDFKTCRTLMAFLCANLIRRIPNSEISVVEEKKAKDFFEKTIRCYNRLFSYIYRYLGEKVGKLGDKNLSHYLEEVKEDYPVLFKGIFLLPDGTLAAEVLRENLEQISENQKKETLLAGLKNILSAELAATRESLGASEEAFMVSRLKDILQNLKDTRS